VGQYFDHGTGTQATGNFETSVHEKEYYCHGVARQLWYLFGGSLGFLSLSSSI
jgi:hypothetical protein